MEKGERCGGSTGRPEWGISYLRSAEILPNGNLFIAGVCGESQKGIWGFAKAAFAEIDRQGREARSFSLGPVGPLTAVHPSGPDRVLFVDGSLLREVDWHGVTQRELRLSERVTLYDAEALSNGNCLVAMKMWPVDVGNGAAPGRVTELTWEGEEKWAVEHPCPVSLQGFRKGGSSWGAAEGDYAVEFDRAGKRLREFKEAKGAIAYFSIGAVEPVLAEKTLVYAVDLDGPDEKEISSLRFADGAGAYVRAMAVDRHVYAMRATRRGTVLLTLADDEGRPQGLAEVDSGGNTLWKFDWPQGTAGITHMRSASLLDHGHLLVVGYVGGFDGERFPQGVVLEMSREGKEIRRLELGAARYLGSVRTLEKDRLLVVGEEVYEIDWKGKRLFTLGTSQDKPQQFRDAVAVEGDMSLRRSDGSRSSTEKAGRSGPRRTRIRCPYRACRTAGSSRPGEGFRRSRSTAPATSCGHIQKRAALPRSCLNNTAR